MSEPIIYWEDRIFNRFDFDFLKQEFDNLVGSEFKKAVDKAAKENKDGRYQDIHS